MYQPNETWAPSATIDMLKKRSVLLMKIRQFFLDKGVMEVETPMLAKCSIPDPQIESIPVDILNENYYLQTSPEFHMKRLLASESGSIYQISKAFRQGEIGNQHNPEFTMLEWYRVGYDESMLMEEIGQLLTYLYQTDGFDKISYQSAFIKYCDLDPFDTSLTVCNNFLQSLDPNADTRTWCLQTYLDYFMSTVIEAKLGHSCPQFIYDFPATQPGLAKIDTQNGRAKRFELYLKGKELANGFCELTDAIEQKERFIKDNERRRANHQSLLDIDQNFIDALCYGLPDCSGVALGIDKADDGHK